MSKYTFKPNDLAKTFFKLTQDEYHFDSVAQGMQDVLSPNMYDEWIPAQDIPSKRVDVVMMSNMSRREVDKAYKSDSGIEDYNPIAIGKLICN